MAKILCMVTVPATISCVVEVDDEKEAPDKAKSTIKAVLGASLGVIHVVGDAKVVTGAAKASSKPKKDDDDEEEDEDKSEDDDEEEDEPEDEEEEEDESEDEEEEDEKPAKKPSKSDKSDKKSDGGGKKIKIKLKG